MPMYHVRNISEEDLAFAVHLTDTMNWNLVEDDFRFMMVLEPDGSFVVLDDSERIGLATTISFGKVGWVGNVIVRRDHRGRGVGSLLVRHAIKGLIDRHVETIGLYAYDERVPFYRRLGFDYDSEFVVLRGRGTSLTTIANLREAQKEDLWEIADLDRLCFGSSRRKLLEPLLLNQDNLCYVSIEGGHVSGFVVAKVWEGIADVGPLVCGRGRSDIALDLLKATLNRLRGSVVSMCVPEKEAAMISMLMGLGFKEDFRVARMYRGRPVVGDCIYVAESLERG